MKHLLSLKHQLFLTISLMILSSSLFSSLAQATGQYKPSHQYKCYSMTDAYMILLTVNVKNVDDKISIQKNLADFDYNYAGNKGNERRFIYEEFDEGICQVVMQVGLLNGAPNGFLSIETRGEDVARTNYNCTLVK